MPQWREDSACRPIGASPPSRHTPAEAQRRFDGLQARHNSHSERRGVVAVLLAITFTRNSALSRPEAAEFCESNVPRKIRGRRECRMHDAPAASHANKKAHERSHHRFAETTGHSLRDGFT